MTILSCTSPLYSSPKPSIFLSDLEPNLAMSPYYGWPLVYLPHTIGRKKKTFVPLPKRNCQLITLLLDGAKKVRAKSQTLKPRSDLFEKPQCVFSRRSSCVLSIPDRRADRRLLLRLLACLLAERRARKSLRKYYGGNSRILCEVVGKHAAWCRRWGDFQSHREGESAAM